MSTLLHTDAPVEWQWAHQQLQFVHTKGRINHRIAVHVADLKFDLTLSERGMLQGADH